MADSPDSVSDPARMIEDWQREAIENAARFKEMAEQVERVSITESVAGGAVRVTVDHNGLPTDIVMTDAVRGMEPDEIAFNVMAAIRKAQSRYPERLAEILAHTVGDDPAARHILAKAEETFPAPPDERLVFDDVDDGQAPRPRPAPARRPGSSRG
jgi:DNA-binding protein YbaB